MSFTTVLQKIGAGIKDVFTFLGSSKGQAIVSTGESLLVGFVPGAAGLVNLVNVWTTEAIKTEALAVAAGEQTGSGTQKAAMVISAVTPQVLAFAQANGLPAPTAAQIATANNALVAFLNAFTVAPVA